MDGSLSSKARDGSRPDLLEGISKARFEQWFDLMGLQRHLKVLGIFARLHIRDEKSAYLDDLPLVVAYVREALSVTLNIDNSIADFREWFEHDLMPVICDQHWYRPIDTAGWML
jgi:aminoglycoside/choline kinase family phosphotransferase